MAVVTGRTAERLMPDSQNLRTPGATRSRWVTPSAIGLTVLLTGLLVAIAVFGFQALSGLATEWGRSNALNAAKHVAASLTTFDATDADTDTQRFLDLTTADFAHSFAGDQNGFIKSLRDGQVSMKGTVLDAGVEDYHGATAHVFVAVRGQVSDTQSPQPHARDYRMDMTMVDEHGWKLDRIEFVA
jgi:Mce-associated membrane protein